MSSRRSITIAQLESFEAAAEFGSMAEAAQRLHTTPSNVSVAVSKLERALGVELLVRHRARGVTLTPAGREALAQVRHILASGRELEEWCSAERGELVGKVRLGCFVSLTAFYVPDFLAQMRQQAPQVTVEVHEATTDVLHQLLADGELDLALTYVQEVPAGVAFHAMTTVRPHVIVAATCDLAQRESVRLADLASGTMVTFNTPFAVRRSRQLFTSSGLEPPPQVLASTIETTRALVAAGLGFAILNQRWASGIAADGNRVVTVELADDVTPLRLGTLTRHARPSAKIRLANDILAAHARERHLGP
ncbi:LysR family transcriptional regulator [Xylanimonas allomyrinae]|uniref:LysR family transcriptional regulator n=1 Tax=Xylanimonas allomyrinae TaxID=2509459 RepID=A0A4P6EJ06_9MICO|nr:LysR family transcriptional regulator [Xylanimonas allomyrinae]QAY62580.1 LysR family transcriptional regulator [Xylanimonas allomyrinae]